MVNLITCAGQAKLRGIPLSLNSKTFFVIIVYYEIIDSNFREIIEYLPTI